MTWSPHDLFMWGPWGYGYKAAGGELLRAGPASVFTMSEPNPP